VELVRTKLIVPPRRAGWIPRPRLVARLGKATAVVHVLAPAGYGKTSLLAEWARARGSAGWVSLDEGDNDPARLAAELAAAVGAGHPAAEGPIAAVVDALAGHRHSLLVVDDAHRVRSAAALEVLATLAERLPEGAVLALGARTAGELPWARWRARSMLLELGPADLRLTAAETAAIVATLGGPALGAEEAALLDARIEGWAAGVALAARALAAREEAGGRASVLAYLRDVRAAHRWALDFLLEEVLKSRPREDQELLMRTSVLERISGPLAAVVAGDPGAIARFEALTGDGLFLIPLDAHGEWFRYHSLFAELLRLRLRQAHPELEPELRKRAAARLEADGDLAGAVVHRLAVGEMEEAARLMEAAAEDTLARGEIATFLEWTDRLPRRLLAERPGLTFRRAFCLFMQARPFSEISSALESSLPTSEGGVVRALIALFRGDIAGAATWASRAAEGTDTPAAFARLVLAAVRRDQGGEEEARRLLEGVARGRSAFGATVALTFLADLEARGGRFDRARSLLDRALALAVDADGRRLPAAGRCLVSLGSIEFERGELGEAERLLKEGLILIETTTRAGSSGAYARLARVRAALGEFEDAEHLLEHARERARAFDVTDDDDRAVEMEAMRVALAKGDRRAARAWADSLSPSMRGDLESRRMAKYEAVYLARVLLAEGRAREARSLVEDVRALPVLAERPALRAEADLLRAGALAAEGRGAEAKAEAVELLRRAWAIGLGCLIREAPPEAAPLLAAAAERLGGAAREWYRSLIRVDSPPAAALPQETGRLSRREREVLPYLRSGLTAAEIGERLFVSEQTVKSHLKAIYAKLEVRNRPGAVARAEELGLLPTLRSSPPR
jgi:LuxR family maltose regulon positive regulatory protein